VRVTSRSSAVESHAPFLFDAIEQRVASNVDPAIKRQWVIGLVDATALERTDGELHLHRTPRSA
jgi:hypothetical protein